MGIVISIPYDFLNQWEHDQKILKFGFHLESISGLYKNKPKSTQDNTQRKAHQSAQEVHTDAHEVHLLNHTMLKKVSHLGSQPCRAINPS